MMKPIQHVIYEGAKYLAVQWDGSFFPSDYEPFQEIGFFEHDNGYDLETVNTDFVLEPGRKFGYVRQDDWIIMNSEGKFSHVSEMFFKTKFEKVEATKDVRASFAFIGREMK